MGEEGAEEPGAEREPVDESAEGLWAHASGEEVCLRDAAVLHCSPARK